MRRSLLITLLITLLAASTFAESERTVISQIQLKPMTKQQYLGLYEMGLDLRDLPGQPIEIFAKPGDLARLRAAGIDYEVIHPDIEEFYVLRNTAMLPFGGFRTYSQIVFYLDSITAAFPSITTDKFSIGLSLEGYEQWVVKISDNPDVDEDEPEVFYNSLIHAREPASAAALLHFMEYLLTNYGTDPEVTDIVNNRELFFLPVVNPDGYIYNEITNPDGGGMWRKNRRYNGDGTYGIDLNRNFSFMWGFDDVGSSPATYSETYRGTSPFSEPETDNLQSFICSRNFTVIHNLHCYSNLEIWPFSYRRFYTDQADFYVNLGDSLTQYNGYTPEIGWVLYPSNGGANDWAWGDTLSKTRSVSLTDEIGSSSDGFWPIPSRISDLCEENVFPNLYLAKIADNPFIIAPPATPSITSPEAADPEFTVEWNLEDDINPGTAYRLMEYQGKQQVLDDAEADYGYWDVTNMVLSTSRSHSGTGSWHTLNYNRDPHWLVSRTPYEVKESDWLTFWIWYDIEEHYDYFYAQISTDGGYTFENLAGYLTTNDDPNNLNLGNGITGSSNAWIKAEFDLSAYEGQQVVFRLSYFTDYYTVGEGVYIDDIENVDLFQSETEISSSIPDTFYTFTSKSDGEYWYRVAAFDAEGQQGRLSPYTYTRVEVLECCVVSGDVDHSGQVDALDIIYFAEWLWTTGSAPACLEEGDVNGDLQVDALDLIYLVEFVFEAGTSPPVPCHPL
ncbi:MAG: immune inhibitor A [Candidatus Zixiibacteriota bacterium]|nr:MAG: immune inhibitor A [candidate division Zixibacteria bacterium]